MIKISIFVCIFVYYNKNINLQPCFNHVESVFNVHKKRKKKDDTRHLGFIGVLGSRNVSHKLFWCDECVMIMIKRFWYNIL